MSTAVEKLATVITPIINRAISLQSEIMMKQIDEKLALHTEQVCSIKQMLENITRRLGTIERDLAKLQHVPMPINDIAIRLAAIDTRLMRITLDNQPVSMTANTRVRNVPHVNVFLPTNDFPDCD